MAASFRYKNLRRNCNKTRLSPKQLCLSFRSNSSQTYRGATARRAGFSLSANRWNSWYTVMSSSQRKQLRWQLSFRKTAQLMYYISSSQRTILLAMFFQGKQLSCHSVVKLIHCKQPGMVFLKYKQVGSL